MTLIIDELISVKKNIIPFLLHFIIYCVCAGLKLIFALHEPNYKEGAINAVLTNLIICRCEM